jgi:hypothetical protein
MAQASCTRPPRIAVWLVDLFIPTEKAESIPGDMLEEFTTFVSRSGVGLSANGKLTPAGCWRNIAISLTMLLRA